MNIGGGENDVFIRSVPWRVTNGVPQNDSIMTFGDMCVADTDLLFASGVNGKRGLVLAINTHSSAYRFFQDDKPLLAKWSHENDLRAFSNTQEFADIEFDLDDQRSCTVSRDDRVAAFRSWLGTVTSMKIAYAADDPCVRAFFAGEDGAGEEVRRLLSCLKCCYVHGRLLSVELFFFTKQRCLTLYTTSELEATRWRKKWNVDETNWMLVYTGPMHDADVRQEWDATSGKMLSVPHNDLYDVRSGRIHHDQLVRVFAHYRTLCSTQSVFLLQLDAALIMMDDNDDDDDDDGDPPLIDEKYNSDNDIRGMHLGDIQRMCAIDKWCISELDRRAYMYTRNEKRGKSYVTLCFKFAGPMATASAQKQRILNSGLIKGWHLFIDAPPNHTITEKDYYDARWRSRPIRIEWTRMDDFERRFYAACANVVAFVATLHSFNWPERIYDELLMWTGVGYYLFRVDRMRVIASTLVSCRRICETRGGGGGGTRKRNQMK